MVLVPYAGKYFGRKCAYWGGFAFFLLFLFSYFLEGMLGRGRREKRGGKEGGEGIVGMGFIVKRRRGRRAEERRERGRKRGVDA